MQDVAAHYRGAELDHIDSPMQASYFAVKNALLKIDCSNALICFQKAVVDNIDCRPPNCHENLLLMQLWLWEVFEGLITIMPLTRSFTIIIKDPIFITSDNSATKGMISVTHIKH